MEIKFEIEHALRSLVPDCKFTIVDNKITYFKSESSAKQPSEKEISDELKKLETEYDSYEYARLRKREYDKLNQFELIYDDKINSTDKWGEAIAKIKKDIPKE
tara:strand:- start:399 stop:707 length:309 start_codon:yes stop_codon:yes gene_type:complete